jgi:sugar phosphate permease
MKKIFYGWYIVGAALLFSMFNSVLFAYGFTTFLTPMSQMYGWTFAEISLASSLRGLETGLLDPFIGMASDRWSARKLIFIGVVISALGIVVFGLATNLAILYLGFILSGLGSALGISIVPMTVISRWFKKNIGKANGILAAGMGAGGLFAPLLVIGIDAFGWKTFVLYIAAGFLIMGLPLSLLFRDRPQDYGMEPDGYTSEGAKGSNLSVTGLTFKQALKTRTFWLIGIAQMLQMMAMHSIAVHQMPYLTSLGLDRPSAALAITIFSIVSLVSRLTYGVLADIFAKKYVLVMSMALTTVGLVLFELLNGSSFAFVALFAVVYGTGAGGAMALRAPVVREYFGIKQFGAIFGLSALMVTLGGVIGAPLTGLVFDTRGSYQPIWFVYAGFTTVSTILLLLLPAAPAGKNADRGQATA